MNEPNGCIMTFCNNSDKSNHIKHHHETKNLHGNANNSSNHNINDKSNILDENSIQDSYKNNNIIIAI